MAKAKMSEADVQVVLGVEVSTVTFGDKVVTVSADGKEVSVSVKDQFAAVPKTKGKKIGISGAFNGMVLHGVAITPAADGQINITVPGSKAKKNRPSNI